MRARRRALSPAQRHTAALRFAALASRFRLLKPHARVAFYIPHQGEADPSTLMDRARLLHCEIFLPVIVDYRQSRMRFGLFRARDALVPNRYGIGEPRGARSRIAPIRTLDVIFLPLVAVDARGWRIGSGAGYYDRCLAHLRSARRWRRPKLIGLAYEFQRIDHVAPEPWDVPVDAVLTERTLYESTPNDDLRGKA
jgi:5-formyltetrahydrofolate cyclo-ligase